ncbi:MAG: MurR/RpiR family transcriptional regulator [Ruminococcaceae bacterium]|nr:MurR/RpiR family transcriptional regulator [Oscillospiraceae bacterium]
MNSDILTIIQTNMSSFSKGQKLIAKYILEFYDKAAFMTASRLGKTVGVSESTVVRFAVELGYVGYPSMQKALQAMILNRLTSVQRIEVTNDRIGDQDVVSMVLQADIDKIRMTNEALDRAAFDAAVEAITKAENIYILGVRSSASLANFLGFYLNYMFDNVRLVTKSGTGSVFEQIVRVGPRDVVIGISFPRYSSSTIKGIQFCRDMGATVIGLTDAKDSPVGQCSHHVLVAKSDMVSLVDSLVAPLSMINALVVATAQRREKELANTLNKLERIWDEYEVYEKVTN